MATRLSRNPQPLRSLDTAAHLIRTHAEPLPTLTESPEHLARQFDRYADCKVLLIGDASHGTSEFYAARAAITKHMIQHHGFNIVAVEADWPDAEAVDRFVRHRRGVGPSSGIDPAPKAKEPPFMRFPTWMWRNMEVHDFVVWLREFNKGKHVQKAAGFYGLDLYSMGSSMNAVIQYLEKVDPPMAKVARERYGGLMVFAKDPHEYGLEMLMTTFAGYEKDVIEMLRDMLSKRLEYSAHLEDGEEFHSGEQNARVVADAERYYKSMYHGRDESWNLRDTHMFQTLLRIIKHRGPESKAIVWAHNSHIGDARATDMGAGRNELNIGQLCKETFGDTALNIGTGTYTGTVAAAHGWGGDMNIMSVRPGMRGSYEELMHAVGLPSFLLDLRKGKCDEEVWDELTKRRLERYIGVIYKRDNELRAHYAPSMLAKEFDGYVWFDESKAVRAFEKYQPPTALELEETWPFGM